MNRDRIGFEVRLAVWLLGIGFVVTSVIATGATIVAYLCSDEQFTVEEQ